MSRGHADRVEALRLQLQMCAAGHPVGVAWEAASDHLAAIVGFAADNARHAEQLVDTVAEDMKRAIRRNWPELREHRSRADSPGRA